MYISKSYFFYKYTGLPAYPHHTCHSSRHLPILEHAQCGVASRCFCAHCVGCRCARHVTSSLSPLVVSLVWVLWCHQRGTTIAIVIVVAAHVISPSSPLRVLHHVSSALSLCSLRHIIASDGMIRWGDGTKTGAWGWVGQTVWECVHKDGMRERAWMGEMAWGVGGPDGADSTSCIRKCTHYLSLLNQCLPMLIAA